MTDTWKTRATYLLFILPFTLVFLVFLGLPFLYAFYLSFHRITNLLNILHGLKFAGLANYAYILKDPEFYWGVVASFYYGALGIPLGIAVSLGLALLVRPRLPGFQVYRTLFFLPFVLDAFVVGIVWTFLYAPRFGLLTQVLHALHLVPLDFGVLAHPATAMPGVVVAMTLKNAGFGMVLFLAALDNIPPEILEAAEMDGATGLQRLWFVILPQLKPVMLFLVVVGIIGALSAFAEFYAMTGGGPTLFLWGKPVGATKVAGYYLFEHFSNMRVGIAAATSFLLLMLSLGISLVSMRLFGRRA